MDNPFLKTHPGNTLIIEAVPFLVSKGPEEGNNVQSNPVGSGNMTR